MGISVTALRNKLAQGGARPSLFYAKIDFPDNGELPALRDATGLTTPDISFFIKSAQIPESTIASIPINFLGREFKVPSIDRTFADWTVTVINDEDYKIRHVFETWIEFMAPGKAIFESKSGFGTTPTIFGNFEVHQLKKSGGIAQGESLTGPYIASYYFKDAFPVNVSPIDLSWDNKDTIEEFSVTFSYQYWEKLPAAANDPAGNNPFSETNLSSQNIVGWSGATSEVA